MKMDFELKGTRMGLKMQAYGIWEKWGAHYSHPYLRMKRALGGGRYPFNGWSPLQPHCQVRRQIPIRPSNYCAPLVALRHLFTSIQLPYTLKRVISNIFVFAYTESFFCIKESLIPFSALFSALKITILWWIKHWCWTINALHEGLEEINEPLSQLVKPW